MLCLGDLAGPSELWVPTEAMEADFFSPNILNTKYQMTIKRTVQSHKMYSFYMVPN